MDPVSHAIIGSAVAAMVPEGSSAALAVGVLVGAELPDIDVVVRYLRGPAPYLQIHRGPTHGILSVFLLSLMTAVVIRWFATGTSLALLFSWTLLGALSHVLFDLMNDYGTQVFWPFSRRWVALDMVPIVDLVVVGTIAAGWLLHLLLGAPRLLVFTGVWVVIGIYLAARAWSHARASRLVSDRFQGEPPPKDSAQAGEGWREERISVHPCILSLTAWRYLVKTETAYLTGTVWMTDGKVSEPERSHNQMDKIVHASLQSDFVSQFSHWVRKPRVTVSQQEGLYRVDWTEARYERFGYSPFRAYAWLDKDLNLKDDGFGGTSAKSVDGRTWRQALHAEMGRRE